MVSRCVAKEVQRNAKWGYFMWKKKVGGWEKRVGKVREESGRGGKGEWAMWKRK